MPSQDGLRLRIAAPAVEGKANRELLRFLAENLAVRRSAVALIAGATSRSKLVEVQGLSLDEATRRLQARAE